MLRINWSDKDNNNDKVVYFNQLPLNSVFRNRRGYGAIYIKVQLRDDLDLEPFLEDRDGEIITIPKPKVMMYEIASGILYLPTNNPLELIDASILISKIKPDLYRS